MIVYIHEKCSTCKAALAFLRQKSVAFETKDITRFTPSVEELTKMLVYQKGELKKLFNTSGILYKELNMKEKLPSLPKEEALFLLKSQGMLIKRPFLLGEGWGLLGFKEKEWEERFSIELI